MKKKKLFDSYALLCYLNKEKGHEKVKVDLTSAETDVIMNEVNIGEVFYILARARGTGKAEYFLDTILPALPITVVSNAFQDVIGAARIKAEYSLSYADCFASAAAIREKASLVTGDHSNLTPGEIPPFSPL